MSNYDNEPEVKIIKQRMARLGVPLEPHIQSITRVFRKPKPIGFGFVCKNPNALYMDVNFNSHFGVDNPPNFKLPNNWAGRIASHFTRGISFREISETDSLHVSVSNTVSIKTLDNCEIHLDTVSISAKLSNDGTIIYDLTRLPQHLVTDLLEVPNLVAHNEGEFFNVGWRF